MKVFASSSSPPLGGIITLGAVNLKGVEIEWCNKTEFHLTPETQFTSELSFCRYLARRYCKSLYGSTIIEQCEVDHWLSFSTGLLSDDESFDRNMTQLDASLAPVTYLIGNDCTIADFIVWGALYNSPKWQGLKNKSEHPNLMRWFNLIESKDCVSKAMEGLPDISTSARTLDSLRKEEGKFIDLPGAQMGQVVVRFPPEASGYLHIGHAKAALLNQYYKEMFSGKFIMRFDDTNPAKEKVDFEKVILEDLELLQIKPDLFTHTSSYFDVMLTMCEKLMKAGKAYVDDTDAETMRKEREQRIESSNRNNTLERNLALWEEMKKGTSAGQKCCVRAKIDMSSDNGCMRDPTIYRCKNELHPRTGDKYKVYPTYDFACPIVDSIEGVTHCLRTTEYHDRDEQFYWLIDALELRKPYIWEYSRLNMTNTVLSKRKLTWFVEQGLVDGWDDPRFPTVRGVLRRGMTVDGLKQFVIAQGSSRSVVVMEWDKIWSFNKKVIDPIAPRYTAVDFQKVPVSIKGAFEEATKASKHPKTSELGEKTVWVGPKVFIDAVDANDLKEGENVTFINWGNLRIKKIVKNGDKITEVLAETNLEDKDYKKTKKLTWLADTPKAPLIPCICVYFEHIISKAVLGKDEDFKNYIGHKTRTEVQMLGDPELVNVKKSEIIQLQRKGFFICDRPYEPPSAHTGRPSPIILFSIPDGHTKQSVTTPKDAEKQAQLTKPGKISITQQENPVVPSKVVEDSALLNDKIKNQGDVVRNCKSQKADKSVIDVEVKKLLDLKRQFKEATGQEWKPGMVVESKPPSDTAKPNGFGDASEINLKCIEQGNKIRKLKADKADKNIIEEEVKLLLELKAAYKSATGQDWKPEGGNKTQSSNKGKQGGDTQKKEVTPEVNKKAESESSENTEEIVQKIKVQGDIVRQLKSSGANKDEIDSELQKLFALKASYKSITGSDYAPDKKPSTKEKSKAKKQSKPPPKETPAQENTESGMKKVTRLGLEAKKEENLSDWYSQVIVKSELIEYYDVSGCYILRPWSFAIWEAIKDWFDKEIKKLGVKNCYFPIFVSKAVLEKEKTHIADFAPEVAWVTKSGDSDLAEPIAVRPTSETVMYPAYAKWVQSYRDLPIKLNQWNNVVRWEFKHPHPFLRTREFLWQEGHTAYASMNEAVDEVHTILDLYARIYTELMAIPVVKGRKTEKEKFAGGDFTLTVEAYVSASGRAIQGATSHHLGQNFSKMFEIIFEDPETQEKKFVYQNSWGITTRTIGVLIMVHADNQGLVLPPKVATIQVVIVPCGMTANLKDSEREILLKTCEDVKNKLENAGLRVQADLRDNYSPGWKFNHWELKGVPLRIEIGPKDIKQSQVLSIRRDTGVKQTIAMSGLVEQVLALLDNIQTSMLLKATDELNSRKVICKEWKDFCTYLDKKYIILSPFCGGIDCEGTIKEKSISCASDESDAAAPSMGAKSLCIPLEQPECGITPADKCINPSCKNKPAFYTLFGRSY